MVVAAKLYLRYLAGRGSAWMVNTAAANNNGIGSSFFPLEG